MISNFGSVSRFFSDLLRIISVTFIIFNHVSWPYFNSGNTHSHELIYHLSVFIQNLGKPSTIIFLFLSGMAFSSKAVSVKFNVSEFYQSRFLRIVPAYIFASIIGMVVIDVKPDFEVIIFNLLYGSSYYHLYFVILIFIFYLFFPMFRNIKYTNKNLLILFTLFLVLLIFSSWINPSVSPYFFNNKNIITDEKILLWMDYFLFGFPAFILGMWFGTLNKKKIQQQKLLIKKNRLVKSIGFILISFILIYLDFFLRLANGLSPDNAGRTWRLTSFIYGLSIIYLFMGFAEKMPGEWLSKMSRAGFLVYLFHPFVIDLMKPTWINHPYEYIFWAIIFSWGTGLIIQELSIRYGMIGLIMGEGDKIFKKISPLEKKLPETLTGENEVTISSNN